MNLPEINVYEKAINAALNRSARPTIPLEDLVAAGCDRRRDRG
jgi:hypothetical protein